MGAGEQQRKELNKWINTNAHALVALEGALSLLLRIPKLIDFENKRKYFQHQIQQLTNDDDDEEHEIEVQEKICPPFC